MRLRELIGGGVFYFQEDLKNAMNIAYVMDNNMRYLINLETYGLVPVDDDSLLFEKEIVIALP